MAFDKSEVAAKAAFEEVCKILFKGNLNPTEALNALAMLRQELSPVADMLCLLIEREKAKI